MSRAVQFVLLLSLLALAVPQCSQSSSADLLQSGTTTFVNSYGGPAVREHLFQIALNFQVSPSAVEVAASTTSYFNLNSAVDFSVRGRAGSQGFASVVLLAGQDNSWTSIRVHFLVSGRPDFILGVFYADTFLLNRANSLVSVSHVVPYWGSSQVSYTAIIQLAGAKSAAIPFLFSFSSVAIANNGLLTATFSLTGNKPTEGVFITYIIFQQNTPIAYSAFNPQTPPSSGYTFVGVEAVSSGIVSYAGSAFSSSSSLACVGGRCGSSCVSQQGCVSSGGQVLNNVCYLCLSGQTVVNGACQNNNQIVNCGSNQVWDGSQCVCASGFVLVNNICYQSCGPNAYITNAVCVCIPGYTYSAASNTCLPTPSCGTNFVLVNGVCVCPAGFTQIGNQCTQGSNCVGGQFWNGVQCICPSGQNFINNLCQNCPANSSWNGSSCVCNANYRLVNGQCVPGCPTNSNWNGVSCVCISGYQLVNGQCVVSCPANSSWNGAICVCNTGYTNINGQCVVSCPANSNWNGNSCVCNTGYQLINGQCVVNCPANSNWNGNSCVCNSGYSLSNGQCVPNCPANSNWNGVSCVCNTGYQLINGQCVVSCPANSNWNGNSCVCNSGYSLSNGQCIPNCPANSNWNGASCVCNSGYSLVNGQCVVNCPANASWNGNSCVCNSGYSLNNGQCVPNCPANSSWNGASCACNSGFQLQGGNCVPICPTNAYWTGANCACNNGFYLIGGSCVQCDPNSVYVAAQGTCVCNAGYFGTFSSCTRCHSSCATCSGAASSQCLTCPTGSTLSNGACSSGCPAGTYNTGTGCASCMANCAVCSSAIICSTCNPGYTPTLDSSSGNIVMICKAPLTGVNSVISLKGNVIGNGIVYQGVAMNLMPTAILANNCDICSDLFLVNVVSTYSGVTTYVEYVLNSQYWFVITFDFSGAAFIPSFQFTVQINPVYAERFNSADMAQKLTGVINPTSTSTIFSLAKPATGADAMPSSLSTIRRQISKSTQAGSTPSPTSRNSVSTSIVSSIFK